jgi:EmrB/QacA subfamily drug resistance transporter
MTRSRLAFLVTCLPMFMVFLDATVVNVAFPDIEASFPQASLADLSWVLSAYSICFAALLVPLGRTADIFGARRIFVAGILLFVGASAACAAAPSVATLVAARALQGVGGAALVPSAQALLMAAVPWNRRTGTLGILAAVGGVAAAAGPTLGALLVEGADWRLVFLINLPIGVLALLLAATLPRSAPKGSRFPDIFGAALVVLGIGSLALGLVQGEWWGWTDPRVLGAFAAAAVILPLFLWRCTRHPSPVVSLPLFRIRSFAAGNAGTLLLGTSLYALLLANALFLTSVWGWSILDAGLALTPTPLATIVAAPLAGAFADRRNPAFLLVAGSLTVGAGAAWFALMVPPTPSFTADWLPGSILVGLGLGMAYATFAGVTVSGLTPESFGLGSGVSAMTRQIGSVLGVAALVALLGQPSPLEAPAAFDRVWAFAALASCLGVIPSLALLAQAPHPMAAASPQPVD